MGRWSKRQKKVHDLWADGLDLRIHCTLYETADEHHFERYWITLGKEVIWDVPGKFEKAVCCGNIIGKANKLIDEYVDTPRRRLLSRVASDPWGLNEIMLAADRRLGRKSLLALGGQPLSEAARRILSLRLEIPTAV